MIKKEIHCDRCGLISQLEDDGKVNPNGSVQIRRDFDADLCDNCYEKVKTDMKAYLKTLITPERESSQC